MRIYASNNPSGIDINLGWYALAECICTKTTASDALLRWCDVWLDKTQKRTYIRKAPVPKVLGVKTKKILDVYSKNPSLRNKAIAKKVGCTPEFVGKVLHKIGVRRNRWDGYISKDPRYSKEKRGV